ncbi:MAG TPA: hypothetical protein DCQ07_11580, partial [Bacteroides sp.]|nr:hypothetical protein [Bacteroides sp.]
MYPLNRKIKTFWNTKGEIRNFFRIFVHKFKPNKPNSSLSMEELLDFFHLNIDFPITDPTWIFFLVLVIILFA